MKQDIVLAFQTGGCLLQWQTQRGFREFVKKNYFIFYQKWSEKTEKVVNNQENELSFSNKQPPVNSDFYVT